VENELLPPSVIQGLMAISALKAGRTAAPEGEPIKPIRETFVQAVLGHVSEQVRAMIRLQLLTGARPGEIRCMRTIDIDRQGKVWIFRPAIHKTQHYGYRREIRIGPKAQEILKPFLNKLDLSEYHPDSIATSWPKCIARARKSGGAGASLVGGAESRLNLQTRTDAGRIHACLTLCRKC